MTRLIGTRIVVLHASRVFHITSVNSLAITLWPAFRYNTMQYIQSNTVFFDFLSTAVRPYETDLANRPHTVRWPLKTVPGEGMCGIKLAANMASLGKPAQPFCPVPWVSTFTCAIQISFERSFSRPSNILRYTLESTCSSRHGNVRDSVQTCGSARYSEFCNADIVGAVLLIHFSRKRIELQGNMRR